MKKRKSTKNIQKLTSIPIESAQQEEVVSNTLPQLENEINVREQVSTTNHPAPSSSLIKTTLQSNSEEAQSKTTMLFAALFLGAIGLHRYLMGYKYWWLMLLTLGGFGIWSLTDFVLIARGKLTMSNGKPLRK